MTTGQIFGLLGPSGSGKSTLLDIIAGRKTTGTITGTILYDGKKASKSWLRRNVGYVEQRDTLIPNMTVEEMLMYTCEMKNSTDSYEQKHDRVSAVLKELNLYDCRNVMIGSSTSKGISGGQSKRLNIGLSLVSSPKILFLDEPTTGLDSFTSNEVMATLYTLNTAGLTIGLTIHSPTAKAFSYIDSLHILLAGRTVYAGANGPQSYQFFNEALGAPAYDQNFSKLSPAEWLTDFVVSADREGLSDVLATRYASSDLAEANQTELKETAAQKSLLSSNKNSRKGSSSLKNLLSLKQQPKTTSNTSSSVSTLDNNGHDDDHQPAPTARPSLLFSGMALSSQPTSTSWWHGLKTLIKYRMKADYRDPAFLLARTADKFITSFILWTLYFGIGDNFLQPNNLNIVALLFMWIILCGFTATSYVPAIILDRALFQRERSDGLYRPITYLLFKLCEELVIVTVVSPVIACYVWFAIDLQNSFAVFWLAYYFTTWSGIALAYFLSALSPNMDVANTAVPAFVTCMLFFAGNIIRYDDIPNYWKWLVSFFPQVDTY